MERRQFLNGLGGITGAVAFHSSFLRAASEERFSLNYALATSLYGDMKLSEILPEVEHSATAGIDLWASPHGTQRDEIGEMGVDVFAEMLTSHQVKLLGSTCFHLSSFKLEPEMSLVRSLGGRYIVCGSMGPTNLSGEELKSAVQYFVEKMKPHADFAAEHGLKIAIQNQSKQILSDPEGLFYFAEFNKHPALGIALAPHHLRDHVDMLPELILTLGDENLPLVYFQEYGDGAHYQLSKSNELEQLPGRGSLDFAMIVRALKYIDFSGVAEIAMHTTPRGLPILDSAEDITEIFNESRIYIDTCIEELS